MERSINAAGLRATDGTLLDRFASSGDQGAFSELIRRHGPMVVRICRRLNGGDVDEADDAAQEVFLTLASRAGVLKTRVSVAGWLYRTSWHIAARHRRAEGIRAGHERRAVTRCGRDATGDARDDVPFAVISSELSAALGRALGTLPENYRNALVLHHLAGHTVEETAHLMEVKVGTAASWLSRGRSALRAKLEGMGFAVSAGVVGAWLEADAAAARDARRAALSTPDAQAGSLTPGLLEGEAGGAFAMTVPAPSFGGAAAAAPAAAGSLFALPRVAAIAAAILTSGTAIAAGHAVVANFVEIKQGAAAAPGGPTRASESHNASPPQHVRSSSQWSSADSYVSGSANVVPEPSSCLIFLAAGGLALLRRSARRASPGG